MDISPATGKILGMFLAYAVSALGLLLAYYNYRKRIIKAETIFSPTARAIIWLVCTIAVGGMVLAAAAIGPDGQSSWTNVRTHLLGILIPALIFIFSFWMTWILYQHFSRRISGPRKGSEDH